MNGILCIDKPAGFTSFDVVAKLRGMAKTKKVGHAGTLDPMATGVLPLFFGEATKACDRLPNHDKRYIATFCLGYTTDTQDATGQVLTRAAVTVGRAQVEAVLRHFTGVQRQVPPMYSAVRVNGQRLYDLARRGVEVARKPREVEFYSLRLLEADERSHTYILDVACSKGTYIRTLCHDLGQALGCGATMTALRRTQACGFSLEHCLALEQAQALADSGRLPQRLLPVETVFSALPRLVLEQRQAVHFCNGVQISLRNLPVLPDGLQVAVFGPQERFLGLAQVEHANNRLHILKLFARREA